MHARTHTHTHARTHVPTYLLTFRVQVAQQVQDAQQVAVSLVAKEGRDGDAVVLCEYAAVVYTYYLLTDLHKF